MPLVRVELAAAVVGASCFVSTRVTNSDKRRRTQFSLSVVWDCDFLHMAAESLSTGRAPCSTASVRWCMTKVAWCLQVQTHAAHPQAGRGGGMVMPPQSGPMMSNGPDDQAMATGPGGMMMQPQLVQVPASAAGMHPQYQSFDGMHMQQAPMHQVSLFISTFQ